MHHHHQHHHLDHRSQVRELEDLNRGSLGVIATFYSM